MAPGGGQISVDCEWNELGTCSFPSYFFFFFCFVVPFPEVPLGGRYIGRLRMVFHVVFPVALKIACGNGMPFEEGEVVAVIVSNVGGLRIVRRAPTTRLGRAGGRWVRRGVARGVAGTFQS